MNYQVDLDQKLTVKKADKENMLGVLNDFPKQCDEAVSLARKCKLSLRGKYHNIVVIGLGGSAIGGDFLRVYMHDKARIPVTVQRNYTLPLYVNQKTLVLVVSYSGNTEETLSAYAQAKAQGASLVAITSGGKLAKRAKQDGVSLIMVPGGLQPRAATGYLFLPTVVVMEKMGLIPDASQDLADLLISLGTIRKKINLDIPEKNNPAKKLAKMIFGHIPVVWGVVGSTESVAMRWKGQINENSKSLAYFNVFPEVNHNEIVGTEVPGDILKKVVVVFLRDLDDHERIQKRFQITRELIEKRVGQITEIWGEGNSKLVRMFTLAYIGDFTSVYLALLYGIDPTPVELITELKQKMTSKKNGDDEDIEDTGKTSK